MIGEEDEDETLVLWDEPREVVSITTEDEYGWQEVVVSGWNPTAPPSKIKAHPAKRFLVAR